MARSKISKFGFIDIEMRDEDNNVVYKRRGLTLGNGIRLFGKFLQEKYGIKILSTNSSGDYLERKLGIKGFSAHEETKEDCY
ncbi:hypothetical protein LCGC14_1118780 [marine sediment metagenome]|uniref:Uncharacterized protein n=1 Tax=marine sediment metagenome TaxID=412755 RepID=A0A0F9QAF6_9ZZZZ